MMDHSLVMGAEQSHIMAGICSIQGWVRIGQERLQDGGRPVLGVISALGILVRSWRLPSQESRRLWRLHVRSHMDTDSRTFETPSIATKVLTRVLVLGGTV